MYAGTLACIVGIFLPWNWRSEYVTGPDGELVRRRGEMWNAFGIVGVQLDEPHGSSYGVLLLIALCVAIAATLLVLLATTATAIAGRAAVWSVLLIVGAVLGLVATMGTLIGYSMLGFTEEMGPGVWVFGVSFIAVALGAIGILSRKF